MPVIAAFHRRAYVTKTSQGELRARSPVMSPRSTEACAHGLHVARKKGGRPSRHLKYEHSESPVVNGKSMTRTK
eukprot:scaffold185200_cov35-Tisochrysis_lutea.AAC.2